MGTILRRQDACRLLIPKEGPMQVEATIYTSDKLPLEDSAVNQLRDAACLPPVKKVLATPDIHQGFGVPIGCVMAMADAIMPAAVGYDINCGMSLLRTGLPAQECDPAVIARSIARDIPLGEGKSNLRLKHDDLELVLTQGLGAIKTLAARLDHRAFEDFDTAQLQADMARVERSGSLPGEFASVPGRAQEKGSHQLGTLGGGNHFVEIQQVDQIYDADLAAFFGLEQGHITVMIHSGSRGLGYQIADEYMGKAARICGAQSGHERELSYITADHTAFERYIGAMHAAGNFAYVNRHIMMLLVRRAFRYVFPGMQLPLVYDVSHNMAQLENQLGGQVWVHRKGATRAFGPRRMVGTPFARMGQPVIIPGSMGTASYLLVGSDQSEQALCSVNHGAGRTMSRTAAAGKSPRRHGQPNRPAAISDEDFRRSMEGITLIAEDRSSVKEEAPAAYKNIDDVIEVVCQAGLACPVTRMKPLAVLKG